MRPAPIPSEFWHVPEGEPEGGTRFLLRPLNQRQLAEVMSHIEERSGGYFDLSGRGLMLTVDFGLVGWEQFNDDDGTPLKFTPMNKNRIPASELTHIANALIRASTLTAEEKKT